MRLLAFTDRHVHAAGDQLLIEVANRLRACVREMDTVARVGGDEFVFMLSELDTDPQAFREQAKAVAEKIRASLAAPYVLTVKQPSQPGGLHRGDLSLIFKYSYQCK